MWSDTDPAGIVWFGVFCRYFEHAEEDLYRRLGSDRTALLRQLNVFMPRTSMQSRVSIAGPARRRDRGRHRRAEITDRRIGFAFDIHERGTGRLICEASYRVACVDATTFAPRPFPDEVVALLEPARIDERDRHAPKPSASRTVFNAATLLRRSQRRGRARRATSRSNAATRASPTTRCCAGVNRCGDALRRARRAAGRSRPAAAARRPGVRLQLLRRDQDRRGAGAAEHAVEAGRLSVRDSRLARRRADRQRRAARRHRAGSGRRASRACARSSSSAAATSQPVTCRSRQFARHRDRRSSRPSRPAAMRRRSGSIRRAAPARRKAASTCSTTWWSAPSCSAKACSESRPPTARSASPSCSSPTVSATRCTFRSRSARRRSSGRARRRPRTSTR